MGVYAGVSLAFHFAVFFNVLYKLNFLASEEVLNYMLARSIS